MNAINNAFEVEVSGYPDQDRKIMDFCNDYLKESGRSAIHITHLTKSSITGEIGNKIDGVCVEHSFFSITSCYGFGQSSQVFTLSMHTTVYNTSKDGDRAEAMITAVLDWNGVHHYSLPRLESFEGDPLPSPLVIIAKIIADAMKQVYPPEL